MKETLKNLKKVYSYGKEFKASLIILSLFSFLFIIINVIYPIYTAKQLTYLTGGLFKQLVAASAVVFAFDILGAARMYVIRKNTQIFFRGTFKRLQLAVSGEILKIKIRDIDSHSSGVFVERMNKDCDELAHIFTVGTGYLTGIMSNLGMFIAILIINRYLFLFYLAASLIVTWLHLKKVREVDAKDKILRRQQESNVGLTGELVRGVRDIKMLGAAKAFLDKTEKSINCVSERTYDMRNAEMRWNFIIGAVTALLELALIFLLIFLVNAGNITAATAMVLFSYKSGIMTNLMQKIGNLLSEVKVFNLSSKRVFSLIEETEFEKEHFGTRRLENIRGDIAFDNVSFGYDENIKILDGISFKIKANETVGFVGKSGAGKTTVFNLLTGMYEVDSGTIRIDGEDISGLDEESLRGSIAAIRQNPYIFNMSIKENLRLVNGDITDDEIKKACSLACIDDFIESLPDKYDTVVGEGGITLSGGQRQRLAIARAFVKKTKIILFDEATSALDNETQAKIQEAVENLKADHTILIIAHRFSTVVGCDKIFFIDGGHICGCGTHEELLACSAEYRSLYESETKMQESH